MNNKKVRRFVMCAQGDHSECRHANGSDICECECHKNWDISMSTYPKNGRAMLNMVSSQMKTTGQRS